MKRFDTIIEVAAICHQNGVTHAILCPGSRCAPLTIAFSRHPGIQTLSIPDERSAGFIALGIAQRTGRPVVLICTSGTAAYNFAPAVAEAFFQEIPLLVFTADRPSEWVGQQDGQTIFQTNLYGRHVKRSYETLPDSSDAYDADVRRIVTEGADLSSSGIPGPIHINFPFSEPLYPSDNLPSMMTRRIEKPFHSRPLSGALQESLIADWNNAEKILLLGGQNDYDPGLIKLVTSFAEKFRTPVVSDITGNLHGCTHLVGKTDLFLAGITDKQAALLQPDLLISFGKSLLSKNMKLFLRKHKPKHHWHIREEGPVADTFRSLTRHLPTSPKEFFEQAGKLFVKPSSTAFLAEWQRKERQAMEEIGKLPGHASFSELEAVATVMKKLAGGSTLHLANSMSVRYANYIGLDTKSDIRVYSNRGTSGIDGCMSTALGHALCSDGLQVLITGDMAFFYDRNAFWNNYRVKNLHILLINNHGGLIFDLIEGPSSVPEKDEYFVTRQSLNAASLCAEFGFVHLTARTRKELDKAMENFLNPDAGTVVLEIETSPDDTRAVLNELKSKISH